MHHSGAEAAAGKLQKLNKPLFLNVNILLARIMLWNRRALLHRNYLGA
jgi:hypothetical protein